MYEMLVQAVEAASNSYDIVDMQLDTWVESVNRQTEINYNDAFLKVAKEDGDDSALRYYCEAATADMSDKIKKAIDKNIEALKKFFNEMQGKILKLATDLKNKQLVADIKKKVKLIPLLGRKKIMVENYNAEAKAADRAVSNLVKLKAKVKAKQAVSVDDIHKVESAYKDEHDKLLGVANAVSVSVNNAIGVAEDMTNDASDMLQKSQKEAIDHMTDLKDMAEGTEDPRAIQALAKAFGSIIKSKVCDFARCLGNIASTIKKSIKSFATKEKDTTESADDMSMDVKDVDTKDIDKAAKDASADSGVAKEDGDDPGVEEDPMDAIANDPWSSIMNDLGMDMDSPAPSDECGAECGTECGDTETATESATDTFETLYRKIVGDSAPSPSDDASLGSKPGNDKLIAELFKDVEAEVKGHVPEYKPAEAIKESAFDKLMADIENL